VEVAYCVLQNTKASTDWYQALDQNDTLVPSHPYVLGCPTTTVAAKRVGVLASHPIYRAACKHCSTTTNSGQRHCGNLVRNATLTALRAAKRPQYAAILAGFDQYESYFGLGKGLWH
jgi:hypothetical protein